jgi:adenine/guanine phosphoribosyltransferase-like PRPP-binding protein
MEARHWRRARADAAGGGPGPDTYAPCRVMTTTADGTYTTTVGSQTVQLPLVQLNDDLTIALLICVDMGVSFSETAGRELAELMRPAHPEIVVSVATMGIPLAIEASRALGIDDYVILHKTPKIHLGEAWAEPVYSITTDAPQKLRMDPARVDAVRGRRVAVVDDVISTGASLSAALRLVRLMDAEPVVIGCFMTEGGAWKQALGDDAALVRALGAMPLFHPDGQGGLVEDWG